MDISEPIMILLLFFPCSKMYNLCIEYMKPIHVVGCKLANGEKQQHFKYKYIAPTTLMSFRSL